MAEPIANKGTTPYVTEGGYTAMDIPHNTSWEIK
jgi:hypothetical protein